MPPDNKTMGAGDAHPAREPTEVAQALCTYEEQYLVALTADDGSVTSPQQ